MAADFALGGYTDDQLTEMFRLLRQLRIGAGDFGSP
jgi:hypothetical protein